MAIEILSRLKIRAAPSQMDEAARLADIVSGRPVPVEDVLIASSDSQHAEQADYVVPVAIDPGLITKVNNPASITYTHTLDSWMDGPFTLNQRRVTGIVVTWNNLTDDEVALVNTVATAFYLTYRWRDEYVEYVEDPPDSGDWVPDHIVVNEYDNSLALSVPPFSIQKEGSVHVIRLTESDINNYVGTLYIDTAVGFTQTITWTEIFATDATDAINQIIAAKRATKPAAVVWIAGNVRLLIKSGNALRTFSNLRGVRQSTVINENDQLSFRTVEADTFCIDTGGSTANIVGIRIVNLGVAGGSSIFRRYNATFVLTNSSFGFAFFPATVVYDGTLNINNCTISGTTICRRPSQIINCPSTTLTFSIGGDTAFATVTITLTNNTSTSVSITYNTANVTLNLNLTESVGGTYTINNTQNSSIATLSARNCRDIAISTTRAYWRLENCYCPNATYASAETAALGVNALVNSIIGTLNITGGIVKAYNSFYCRTFSNTFEAGLHDLRGLQAIPELNEYLTNVAFRNTRIDAGSTVNQIKVKDTIAAALLVPGISKVMIAGYNAGSPARARVWDMQQAIDSRTFTLVGNLASIPAENTSVLILNQFPQAAEAEALSSKMLILYGQDKLLRMFVDSQGAQLEYDSI